MINFNIIEEDDKEIYEEYIRLYNSDVPVKKIGEELDISRSTLRSYYRRAVYDDLITPRMKGGHINCKYYSRTKNGSYAVYKRINGKKHDFGSYPTEEIAEYIVNELKKVNWNRKHLEAIRLKAVELFPLE